MKTTFRLVLVTLLTVGVFSACSFWGESIKPSKTYITRDYKVKPFDQMDISTAGDIYYTQSTDGKTTVQIYGPDNIVELIQVAVKNNTLLLLIESRHKIRSTKKLRITVSSPDLKRIEFKGVGDVRIEDAFATQKLEIENKGVGNIEINDLTCDDLIIQSIGVGNVSLKGKAKSANLMSKGVGNIQAKELEATHVEASSKGVGDVSCFATESLKASVQGVGNITYKGSPKDTSFNKGGIGTIKNI